MGATGYGGGAIQTISYELCQSRLDSGQQQIGRVLKCRSHHSTYTAVQATQPASYGAGVLREDQLPPCGLSPGRVTGLGDCVSVTRAFTGATVLVTGATGYIGSLVVEQLLRIVPGIRKIYVIVRNKRGMSGQQRMERLLQRSMWHLHRQDGRMRPEVRAKIGVVSGDLLQRDCGVSAPQRRRLAREVDYVIHCAASISFTEHIHTLLGSNYEATHHLANLAAGFSHLRAFVHLSSAYVNCDRPRGSHVEERLYPMDWGCNSTGEAHTLQSLAAELRGLSPDAASRRMEQHLQRVGMPNAYVFSKRMAEALISSYASERFPVCIVRPSLVGCTARAPHSGYFGNNAGPTAVAMAFATGIMTFTSFQADSVFDVVPGDICSSIILASCAATAQRERRITLPLVVHACTSTSNPATLYGWWDISYRYWSVSPPPLRLTVGGYPRMDTGCPPVGLSEHSWAFRMWTMLSQAKFWLLSGLLSMFGQSALAAKLWNGWQAWKTYNHSALDFNLFFCSRASRQLEAALPTDEAAALQLVWRTGLDDWVPYMHSHFDQIRYLHFRQAQYAPQLKDKPSQ